MQITASTDSTDIQDLRGRFAYARKKKTPVLRQFARMVSILVLPRYHLQLHPRSLNNAQIRSPATGCLVAAHRARVDLVDDGGSFFIAPVGRVAITGRIFPLVPLLDSQRSPKGGPPLSQLISSSEPQTSRGTARSSPSYIQSVTQTTACEEVCVV